MPELPQGIHIRKLDRRDVEQIKYFQCANQGEPFTADVEREIQLQLVNLWKNPREAIQVLVAAEGETIVGVIAFEAGFEERDIGYIHLVAVVAGWRRRKVATCLKEVAMSMLVDEFGCIDVSSVVAADNLAMRAVNQRWNPSTSPDKDDPAMIFTNILFE